MAGLRASANSSHTADTLFSKLLDCDIQKQLERAAEPAAMASIDPFGLDVQWFKYFLSTLGLLSRYYFRVEVFGIDRLPPGRSVIIANHAGHMPIDGLMMGSVLFFNADPPRIVRSMFDKEPHSLPFFSIFLSRIGQSVGVPENGRRLLELGAPLLVFPEGARGSSKPYSQRYQLTNFSSGFMRLALETNSPVVPVGVIGSEEQYISVGNIEFLAKKLGWPAFPIIPQLLIPGGQLPLPTKYRIYFGEPMTFEGGADESDAAVDEKAAQAKAAVQELLNRGMRERKAIFW